MKKMILSLLLLSGLVMAATAQQPARPADELMKEAYQQAIKDNKHVLVIFHASWCTWCRKMDASINDSTCKKYFDANYVIVHLTVSESKGKEYLENPGAEEFKTRYNGKDQGLPFWLLFDKDGKLVSDSKIRKEGEGPEAGENIGCPASEAEVQFFIDLLKKTSRLTAAQLAVIQKRFRQNEHD